MKKGILFALILVLGFGFVACNETTTASTTQNQTTAATTTEGMTTTEGTTTVETTADTVGPVITGVEDVTIYLDATFDPMDGVSAMDNVDGDLTDEITVAGSVDVTSTGSYFLKYTVEDAAGNKTEATRYVTVEVDPNLIGDEMIQNGDFSLGAGIWAVALNEGGAGSLSVIEEGDNKVGALEITAAGWSDPFPRLDSNVTEFENGLTYEVTFMAKADAARPIKVQVGQLLPAAPWFVDYMPGQTQIFDLTTDWQTFSFKFTMNQQDSDAGAMLEGQLLFNHGGTIVGETTTPAENYNTTVYYDDVAINESTPDPDTTAPIITGADDVTIETGDSFDPLDGVSVFDVVDGAITIDASNVSGTVDANTPGEYTLTYTVSDEAGNEATATRVVTVVDLIFNDASQIVDPSFDTTTTIIDEVQDADNGYADITQADVWYKYIAGWDGAAATVSVVDNAAVLDITALGNQNFGVILKQKGIELMTGETYKLTFTASATADRDMEAKVTDDYYQSFNLTSTPTEFSFIFTYTGEYNDMARVMFMLGNTANAAVGTVTIDDVMISVLQQPEMVQNADFSNIGWDLWAGEGGAATLSTVDGEFQVDVTAVGNETYSVQFSQAGIDLVNGTQYIVTFDAYAATADRDVIFKLLDASYFDQMTAGWEGTTVSLTTTLQSFSYTFTAGADSAVKFYFDLGNVGTTAPAADMLYFDNLMIQEYDGSAAVVGTNQTVNATADQAVDWSLWAGEGGAATLTEVDGEAVVDVTNLGSANWNVQLFQEGLTLIPGATYTVVFTAYSPVVKEINVKLIDANSVEFGSPDNPITLTDTATVYTYTFVYDGTAASGKIDFELGLIGTSVVGEVHFDNIYFFRNFNAQE